MDLEDDTVLNMELRPQNKYSRSGAVQTNRFGSRIPANYFCRYEFNLNPQISYDLAIKKFFHDEAEQHEIIDFEVVSATDNSTVYLEDSYLWVAN